MALVDGQRQRDSLARRTVVAGDRHDDGVGACVAVGGDLQGGVRTGVRAARARGNGIGGARGADALLHAVTVAVVEPFEPRATVRELGDAERLKSGALVDAPTVNEAIAVLQLKLK